MNNINEMKCNYEGEDIKEIIISYGITKIDSGAFRNCSLLTNVLIPNTVSQIGDFAFEKCTSLVNIQFQKVL